MIRVQVYFSNDIDRDGLQELFSGFMDSVPGVGDQILLGGETDDGINRVVDIMHRQWRITDKGFSSVVLLCQSSESDPGSIAEETE